MNRLRAFTLIELFVIISIVVLIGVIGHSFVKIIETNLQTSPGFTLIPVSVTLEKKLDLPRSIRDSIIVLPTGERVLIVGAPNGSWSTVLLPPLPVAKVER